MSGVLIYFLFAVSVGLWACYELMWPAIKKIAKSRPDDVLVKNKFLAYIVMFCIATITAPLTVFSIIIPSLNAQVMDQLINDRD